MNDRAIIIANHKKGNTRIRIGTRLYILGVSTKNDDIRIGAIGRRGKWVERWERQENIQGYRILNLSPAHPLYGQATYNVNRELLRIASILSK